MTAQTIKLPYEPQEKQILFHSCAADEVFYGGAAGGGKSYALLYDGLNFCLKHANVDAVLFRRTFPQLEMYHIQVSRREWPSAIGKYNASKYYWQFSNGSRFLFRALKNPGDQYEYQTAEFAWIGFDELTHFLEDQYTYLLSRNRTAQMDASVPRQVKSASNPGNIGHAWVKRRFVDPAPPNTIFARRLDDEDSVTRCFIPATVYDNDRLMERDPSYVRKLKSLPKDEQEKLLRGNWEIAEGAAFPEWRTADHVIPPFPVPPSWRVDMCLDWGYERPFWIGWIAWNYDDRPYLIREWYGCRMEEFGEEDGANKGLKMPAYKVAAEALKKESSVWRVRKRIVPADIWKQEGTEKTIASELIRGGFKGLVKANRAREAGKQRIHALLQLDDATDEPFLRIFSTCRGIIRTLPLIQLDESNPEDVDSDGEDHAYDGVRYGLMSHNLPFAAMTERMGEPVSPEYQRRNRARRVAVGAGASSGWKTN